MPVPSTSLAPKCWAKAVPAKCVVAAAAAAASPPPQVYRGIYKQRPVAVKMAVFVTIDQQVVFCLPIDYPQPLLFCVEDRVQCLSSP